MTIEGGSGQPGLFFWICESIFEERFEMLELRLEYLDAANL